MQQSASSNQHSSRAKAVSPEALASPTPRNLEEWRHGRSMGRLEQRMPRPFCREQRVAIRCLSIRTTVGTAVPCNLQAV